MAELKIKEALIRFNDGIKKSDAELISDSLSQLEALLGEHRSTLHPQLVHFLEGRSYAKAMAWLGVGQEMSARSASPPGGCGGGKE